MGKQRATIECVCRGCGEAFLAAAYEVKRGGGKFCSRYCQRSAQAKENADAMRVGMTLTERSARWRAITPSHVHVAHDMVETAIANGSLIRQPCEKCGATRVDAHHDDYSKPLAVRWLCRGHHLEHHRGRPA